MSTEARVAALYEGHLTLDEAIASVPLSRRQKIELRVLTSVIAVTRPLYWFVRKRLGRPFEITADLEEVAAVPSPARGARTRETDQGDYLTQEQIAEYEQRGVIGPLPLLTPEEATALRDWVVSEHEADWHGKSPLGADAVAALKHNDLWNINHGAIWQERNFDEMKDMAQHPVLAQRVASLLGDEVVVWRTQIFFVDHHQQGTFWHSATTFTEDGDLPALTAPEEIPEPMINVSCWIALEDVDKDNACLRLIPGTHSDVRLDTMIRRFSRDRVGFLMSMEPADRRSAIIALRYSGDIFMAGRLAFDLALRLVPDLYETATPEHYPMRAGECLLFSSNNLHGSYGNATDAPRLAMGIRYTSADVGIYEGQPTIPYGTGTGNSDIDTTPFRGGVPAHTSDGTVTGGPT